MAEVKWIKICTDIFDDEKILLIESMPEADSIIVIWFKLLCMSGKQNNGGVFMLNDKLAYTDEMLATIFRKPLNTVRLALQTFEQFEMIAVIDNIITIPNWEKHQSLDKMEKLKAQNRDRVAKHREKQKLLASNKACNVTVMECNATDIEEDKDIDIDKEKDKKKKPATRKKTATRFSPPTLEEIQAYCNERKNNVNAKKFYDYFTASGWYDSKGNKVKSWKQKVITWESYSNDRGDQSVSSSFDTDEAFEKAVKRGMKKRGVSARAEIEREVVKRFEETAQNPPKTAGDDEAIRERMQKLKERLAEG